MSRLRLVSLAILGLAACGNVQSTNLPDAAPGPTDAPPPDAADGMMTLRIVRGGAGAGTITSNPAGIDCGATCTGSFPAGTLVTLTASPSNGSEFIGWGGACAGTLTSCSITLNASNAVNTEFRLKNYTVTVAVDGNGAGSVTSSPTGISCPGMCAMSVPYGTQVTLSGAQSGVSTFLGWAGGGCTGTAGCAFVVTGDTLVHASFALNYTLVVTETGSGAGTVTSNPAGINCGTDCNETYNAGTSVTLTASASADSVFTGWSGGGCSGTSTCTVTLNAAAMVTANFDLKQYTLTVATDGSTGTGTVASNPAGIACPTDCTESYASGTSVTLTPTASNGSTFSGWSGDCSGTGACVVAMTQARSVTARFALNAYALTVTENGTGTGTVTASPEGILCPGDCTVQYLFNTSVTLTATPTFGATFGGWGGACAGASTTCVVTMTQAQSVTASFTAHGNLMFVTSTTYTGNLGGLAGADAACQARANAAGRPGTYKAWLSTATVNANSRFGSASGWVRPDGKPFANTVADVGNGKIFYPPEFDEFGNNAGDVAGMTNTMIGGVAGGVQGPNSDSDCEGFTSTTPDTSGGFTAASSWMFEINTFMSCSSGGRLFCFGVDSTATVTLPAPPTNARRAFQRIWGPGGGIAAADTACQSEATAAGLSGTYKALLATVGASALSRFNLMAGPWVRVDNAVILPTAQAWSTATEFDTGLNLSADGQTYFGNVGAWSGAIGMTAAGTVTSTCNNWTDTTATAYVGGTGTAVVSRLFANIPAQCNITDGLLITCLQE